MYIQHVQGLCQSRLGKADHALVLVAPATTAVEKMKSLYGSLYRLI
jgi:hypothetical protein